MTKRKTISLAMIVKDESHIIRRCLQSVRPLIDYWVIVDTGSTDGTQQVIRDCMGDIPGELHERPWRNFGHNRSESLSLAAGKADYSLVMDADDFLVCQEDLSLDRLDQPYYHLRIADGETEFYRIQLVNNQHRWYYRGVLHEYISCDELSTDREIRLPGLVVHSTREGSRSQHRDKYLRDAEILESGLREEPDNARYVFYLAQSYRDAGDLDAAIDRYRRRVSMGGWWEEVFYALYQIGALRMKRGDDWGAALDALLEAHNFAPHRAEPLYDIARHYRLQEKWPLAYRFAKWGVAIPYPERDRLFVARDVYQWRLLDEAAIAAYWTGGYQESLTLNRLLLDSGRLPDEQRSRIRDNLRYAQARVQQEQLSE